MRAIRAHIDVAQLTRDAAALVAANDRAALAAELSAVADWDAWSDEWWASVSGPDERVAS